MSDDDTQAAWAHAQETERWRMEDDFRRISELLSEQEKRNEEFRRDCAEFDRMMIEHERKRYESWRS